jgi:hypothetical protein
MDEVATLESECHESHLQHQASQVRAAVLSEWLQLHNNSRLMMMMMIFAEQRSCSKP